MSSRWGYWSDVKHENITSACRAMGYWLIYVESSVSHKQAVKDDKRLYSLLHPLWFGHLRKSTGIPLPIHNYLLISCFVSAMVARANEMNPREVRKESLVWDRPWRAWLHSHQSSFFTCCATWESIFSDNKRKDIERLVLRFLSLIIKARADTVSVFREIWSYSVSSTGSLVFFKTWAHCARYQHCMWGGVEGGTTIKTPGHQY